MVVRLWDLFLLSSIWNSHNHHSRPAGAPSETQNGQTYTQKHHFPSFPPSPKMTLLTILLLPPISYLISSPTRGGSIRAPERPHLRPKIPFSLASLFLWLVSGFIPKFTSLIIILLQPVSCLSGISIATISDQHGPHQSL